MKRWKKLQPLMRKGIVLIVIGFLLVFLGKWTASAPDRLIPKSGKWHNDELNMTMEFSSNHSIIIDVIKDGETIHCSGAVPFHTAKISVQLVEVQENGTELYLDTLYNLLIKNKSKNKMTVIDSKSGEKYIFYAVAEEDGA